VIVFRASPCGDWPQLQRQRRDDFAAGMEIHTDNLTKEKLEAMPEAERTIFFRRG
jgi:hypothetical protein